MTTWTAVVDDVGDLGVSVGTGPTGGGSSEGRTVVRKDFSSQRVVSGSVGDSYLLSSAVQS